MRIVITATIMVVLMTLLFGIVFPLAITGIALVVFPHQAKGSLVINEGKVVGSELIGQSFSKPVYFHPRPSNAGSGYDGANSSGTNLGPTSDKLINGVHKKSQDGNDAPGNFEGVNDLAITYRRVNGLPSDAVLPADAVTRSASGLDPHISPANANLQASRVAKARGMLEEKVRALILKNTEGRAFGLLGEPGVNVFKLNLQLDKESSPR